MNSSNVTLSACSDGTPTGNILDFWMGYNAGTSNNGDVINWNATGYQSFVRTYGYDSLNRVSTMADSITAQPCRGLSWTYDAWGNRTDQSVTSGTCGTFHQSVDSNNRFTGSPYLYDAAGNLYYDGSHSYAYDAENRLTQVDSGYTATYVYDAEGLRVRKTAAGVTTDFMYDVNSNIVSEVTPSWDRSYIRAGGNLLAQYSEGTTYFVHPDHLGSARLLTRPDQSVRECDDYYPYGELTSCGSTTASLLKFTGKERDGTFVSETGLDNFGARYNSSLLGRFMSPDPAGNAVADPTNPQSWNMYSYVTNNPTTLTDPTGLFGEGDDGGDGGGGFGGGCIFGCGGGGGGGPAPIHFPGATAPTFSTGPGADYSWPDLLIGPSDPFANSAFGDTDDQSGQGGGSWWDKLKNLLIIGGAKTTPPGRGPKPPQGNSPPESGPPPPEGPTWGTPTKIPIGEEPTPEVIRSWPAWKQALWLAMKGLGDFLIIIDPCTIPQQAAQLPGVCGKTGPTSMMNFPSDGGDPADVVAESLSEPLDTKQPIMRK